AKYVNKKSDMDLAAKGLGAKEWNNSLKTKLSLLPKKLFRIRMSRNFGMKMLTMTNLSTECLIQHEFIAAVIAYYVHPVNIQTACLIMEGAEFTENIINGVERPVKAAELFAFTLRVRAGNTDVLTDAEENVRQKLRA